MQYGERETGRQLDRPDLIQKRLERMEAVEDEIFQASSQIVAATLAGAEIDPSQPEPPASWVATYGPEGAKQRHKVAVHSWLPKSQAPMFMHMAQHITLGVARMRALRAGEISIRELNVKIALPAPTSAEHPGPVQYEVREIE